MSRLWNSPTLFLLSFLLRLLLLTWGRYQDTHSPLKYTDIDYLVFTDASRYISRGQSPYQRDTYRYTPLLAWLLYPTVWPGSFDFGKVLFALGDLVAGWLIYDVLRREKGKGGYGLGSERACRYAAVWVLNPMVANISTRGSSEGLLAVFVVAVLWAVLRGQWLVGGAVLGLAVHFKIYPFVYAASLVWWVAGRREGGVWERVMRREVVMLGIAAGVTFMGLNVVMYSTYGWPFVEHSYAYHLTRIDHRHNFSVYSTLLHLRSAVGSGSGLKVEALAFVPQLFLAVVTIPLALSRKDLAGTMLAQTFAFVTFNKVCTSQYFLWYMVFLPFYLPDSVFMRNRTLGISALAAWAVGQAIWLQQGYQLEFLGNSTFIQLWHSTISFFAVNCWILGVIVSDIASRTPANAVAAKKTN
ncbi:PIG-M-domain-containing protein [Elsinoe ampelina]|uniref:GPI mannosyltransferase 1 n=1 Tax=Elsinoe ampelina TaxID=302913 RepID=A0A6A6GDA0_9PEZI|nr:PIG-M-domain-containing protein [Elsinoe ampelina]